MAFLHSVGGGHGVWVGWEDPIKLTLPPLQSVLSYLAKQKGDNMRRRILARLEEETINRAPKQVSVRSDPEQTNPGRRLATAAIRGIEGKHGFSFLELRETRAHRSVYCNITNTNSISPKIRPRVSVGDHAALRRQICFQDSKTWASFGISAAILAECATDGLQPLRYLLGNGLP